MASLDELKTALVNAHNAGDVEAARVLASEIQKRGGGAAPKTAAEEVGAFEAGLIGAGRTTDKVIQGVRQLWNKAIGDQKTLDEMAATEAEKDRLYKPLKDARPIATGIGEAVPMMAVPVGSATGAGMIAKSAMAGALPGLLSYGSAEDRLKAGTLGGVGGAIGGGIGLGMSRLLKPSGPSAIGISDDAIAAADRLGVKLTAGQKTGNPAMQNFENYLARSPGSSGAMKSINDANVAAMNRAAARSIGQNSDNLSEGLFANAKNAIGSEFQRLQSITAPQLGDDFLNAVAKVDAANMQRGAFKSKEIDSLINKSLDLAVKGKLTGTAYKEIRSQLSDEASKAFKNGDATIGQAYKAIRKALDDAAESSLPAAERKAWATTREQWAAYKALTKSNVAEGGNVSAARLASALRQRNGDALRTGALKGDLADIARLGEAVKGVQNPNSGQLVNQMLYGNPLSGIPMMAANKTAQLAYTNPLSSWYMSRGLLPVGSKTDLLLEKVGGPLGMPIAAGWLGAQ